MIDPGSPGSHRGLVGALPRWPNASGFAAASGGPDGRLQGPAEICQWNLWRNFSMVSQFDIVLFLSFTLRSWGAKAAGEKHSISCEVFLLAESQASHKHITSIS